MLRSCQSVQPDNVPNSLDVLFFSSSRFTQRDHVDAALHVHWDLATVHGGWTSLVNRCHSTQKIPHHVVLRVTLNGSVSLVSNSITAGGRFAAHCCIWWRTTTLAGTEHTAAESIVASLWWASSYCECLPCASTLAMRRAQSSPCLPRNSRPLTRQPQNVHFSIVTTSNMRCAPLPTLGPIAMFAMRFSTWTTVRWIMTVPHDGRHDQSRCSSWIAQPTCDHPNSGRFFVLSNIPAMDFSWSWLAELPTHHLHLVQAAEVGQTHRVRQTTNSFVWPARCVHLKLFKGVQQLSFNAFLLARALLHGARSRRPSLVYIVTELSARGALVVNTLLCQFSTPLALLLSLPLSLLLRSWKWRRVGWCRLPPNVLCGKILHTSVPFGREAFLSFFQKAPTSIAIGSAILKAALDVVAEAALGPAASHRSESVALWPLLSHQGSAAALWCRPAELSRIFFFHTCRRRTRARVKVMESCAGTLENGTPKENMLVQAHQWCCLVWPYREPIGANSRIFCCRSTLSLHPSRCGGFCGSNVLWLDEMVVCQNVTTLTKDKFSQCKLLQLMQRIRLRALNKAAGFMTGATDALEE